MNYTATFSSDGYYKGTESITVASGTLFSISDIPQKALQTFDGYYDSNNVCYVNSEGNGVRAFDKAQNTTFYAKFHQDATVFD